jgi:signal transduction histidine kinase
MGFVTLLGVFLLIYPMFFRAKSRLNTYFMLLIGSAVIWALGYTLDIAVTDFEAMVFLNYLQYIGIVTLPVFFFFFILYLTKEYAFFERKLLLLLFFPPLIHYTLMFTNDFHHLYYISTVFIPGAPFPRIDYNYGPFFYSNTIYSYILLLCALVLIVQKYRSIGEQEKLLQKQLIIFLIGAAFPVVGNIIRVTGIEIGDLSSLDLTPISFIFAFVLFTYALFEVGFLDILPIARHAIFEDIHDILIVLNTNMQIVDINKAARDLFSSLTTEQIFNQDLKSTFESLTQQRLRIAINFDTLYSELVRVINNESLIFDHDIEFIDSSETVRKRYFNILGTPLRQMNKAIGVILIIRDIGARRDAETLLLQKNQMQDVILKLLSHDLRNHLNVIKGYSELAIEAKSKDDMKQSLEAIDVKSSAILSTINQVTEYLKIDDLKSQLFQKFDLNQVIVDSIEAMSPECSRNKVRCEFTPSSDIAIVWANVALYSVVQNLLQNAIKFSPQETIIYITIEMEKGTFWHVKIADQGTGIPTELQEDIFKPFVSFGVGKGTGLGLTIAKSAIEFFAGEIWVTDNTPSGTILHFTLPQYSEN